ncbi:MAG: Plug domain-containing protein [Bacteroidaceae bacterium]
MDLKSFRGLSFFVFVMLLSGASHNIKAASFQNPSPLSPAPISVKNSVLSYFRTLISVPQEKVYLHLDRTSYFSGEHIWFKAYLVSAVSNRQQDAYSNYITVDLVDRNDSVRLSKKVRRENGAFAGELRLDAKLPAGDYYLRAYTNWMRNEDPDFLYSRLISIENPIDTEISTKISYLTVSSDKLRTMVTFLHNGDPFKRELKFKYAVYRGESELKNGSIKTDDKGKLSLDIPFDQTQKNQRVELLLEDDTYQFSTSIYPYSSNTDYNVTFFPEGGDLLAAPNQIVAFKVQATNGYSLPITGRVLNSKGVEVAQIKTMTDGMGAFNLNAESGEKYTAEVTSEGGIKHTFDLPEVKEKGIKLMARHTSAGISYQLIKTESTPWPDTLYVVAHTRGLLRYMQIVGAQLQTDLIQEQYLKDGITHLLLLNKAGKTISERLVFVKNARQPFAILTPDKKSYGPREKVQVALNVQDPSGAPLSGDFSVSIVDEGLVPQDSLAENICSNLLLTSDLKGFIENPGRYFLLSNKRALAELNLLMLTHGWRRFKMDDLTQKPDTSFRYFVERGMTFMARVKPVVGSPQGLRVTGTTSKPGSEGGAFFTGLADAEGNVVLSGPDFPDSTKFEVRSYTSNKLPCILTMMPELKMRVANTKTPYPDGLKKEAENNEAMTAARKRYFAEGGMPLYSLKEVEVKAKKNRGRSPSDPNYLLSTLSDRHFDESFFKDLGMQNAFELLQQVPGLTVSEDGASIVFMNTPSKVPLLIINDLEYDDHSVLQSYTTDEIERLDILKYNAAGLAVLGSKGSNGAIILSVKTTVKPDFSEKKNVVYFSPKGYNSSIEFYNPVYSTPTLKAKTTTDLRNTLYWNPHMKIDDSGIGMFDYYTDDRGGAQQIILEGLTTDGRPIRLVQHLGAKKQ